MKIFSSAPSKFSTDDGLIGWGKKRERQMERNKQGWREAEIEEVLCVFVCVRACVLTPLRNDL